MSIFIVDGVSNFVSHGNFYMYFIFSLSPTNLCERTARVLLEGVNVEIIMCFDYHKVNVREREKSKSFQKYKQARKKIY